MNLAEQLEQNEKYEEAYVEYRRLYMNNNEDINLLTKLAHIAHILNKTDDAKMYYEKILKIDPPNILAHEQLIDIYVHEDKFKYYLLRGNLHALQQQMSYAKSDFKKAIDNAISEEEALPARYLLAGLCEGLEKYNEAIAEYLRISDFDKQNSGLLLKLAELYEKTEGLSSSISVLEMGYSDRGLEDLKEYLAGYYIRNSQPDKALEITANPLTKIRALFDLNKLDEGFELLNQEKENYKNHSKYYSLLAQYYYQKDMYEEGLKAIEKFSNIEKNSPLVYQMRALIYQKQNDYYNEHLNWGKYNIVRGNKDVALNEYMSAYRYNMNDIDLVETIAVLLESDNDKTKANEFYERILVLEENNINALQKVAQFKESIGDLQEAYNLVIKLKEIDSRNEYAKQNLERLKDKLENSGLINKLKSIFCKKV